MASPGISLLKKVGTEITGAGRFNRDSVLVTLTVGEPEKQIAALRKVALGGEYSAELMLMEPVSKLMGHQLPKVCAAAVHAMGCMGLVAMRYAEDIAEFILKHPDETCRCAALEALGKLGGGLSRTVRQAVVARLADPATSVRRAAVGALSAMSATGHTAAVKEALEDQSPAVRAAALEALAGFIATSEEAECVCPPDCLLPHISEALAGGRYRLAGLRAARLLGARAPDGCAGAVVEALTDGDGATRSVAAAAVGSISAAVSRDAEAMRALEALLANTDPGVRAAAAHAAGEMGQQARPMVAAVAALLSDDAEDLSVLAAQMGTAAQRQPPQLRHPRCAALVALGKIGDVAYLDAVTSALGDNQWEVRLSACDALGRFGEAAKREVDALIGILEDDVYPVRAMAVAALGELKSAEALSALALKLEDTSHTVRLQVLDAIAIGFGANAGEYSHDVFKMLNDPVPQVRASAIQCLALLGEAGLCYAGVIGSMMCEDDAGVRCAALRALAGMGRHGAAFGADIAERANHDPSAMVRQTAAATLEFLASEGAEVPQPLVDFAYMGKAEKPTDERARFEGLGKYYADIQDRKRELQNSGQWIEGIF